MGTSHHFFVLHLICVIAVSAILLQQMERNAFVWKKER